MQKRPPPACARGRAPNPVVPPQFAGASRNRPFQVRRDDALILYHYNGWTRLSLPGARAPFDERLSRCIRKQQPCPSHQPGTLCWVVAISYFFSVIAFELYGCYSCILAEPSRLAKYEFLPVW